MVLVFLEKHIYMSLSAQEWQTKVRSFKKGLEGSERQRKRAHPVDTRFQKDALKISPKRK